MAGDTYLTVSGNLTAIPKSGVSRSGSPWARLRVASTSRVFDRGESQWRDGETMFLDVICWRRLAENVVATLERGDRVLVSGRLRQRSYEDQQGAKHTVTELEAKSVGPDLVRAPARLLRAAGDQQEPAGAAAPVPEVAVSEVAVPEVVVPEVAVPEVAVPEVAVAG
jgi:single-strand DNA-binding protein